MEKLAIDGGNPVRTEGFGGWPVYGELEYQYLREVLESGKWGGTGEVKSAAYTPKLPEAEKRFAQIHHAEHAVSVVNGTVAITVALQAVGIKPGDEVIIPPYTFIATATAVLAIGAIPVFVDIEENTLNIDPEKVEQAITPKTKAIIAVHVGGAPANMTRLGEIAKKHRLALIEDAAQAVGAEWDGQRAGAIGDLGTFSFQSTKNLNAGEGGMILTNSKKHFEKAWSICNVGRVPDREWYYHENIGQNYRLTEFQAAILLAQMTRLEEQMKQRETNARLLNDLLGKIEGISLLKQEPRVTRNSNHLYLFKINSSWTTPINKNDFVKKVNAEGIPIAYGYYSLNHNKAIRDAVNALTGQDRFDDCPVCDRMSDREVVWLSQDILLSDEKAMHDIAKAVQKVMDHCR